MSGSSSTHFQLIANNEVRTNFNPPPVSVKKGGLAFRFLFGVAGVAEAYGTRRFVYLQIRLNCSQQSNFVQIFGVRNVLLAKTELAKNHRERYLYEGFVWFRLLQIEYLK